MMTQGQLAQVTEGLADGWEVISYRPRSSSWMNLWHPVQGASMDINDAKARAASGLVVVAHFHTKDAVFLVVRPTNRALRIAATK